MEKVWNPLKKGYWTKENLTPPMDVQRTKVAFDQFKTEMAVEQPKSNAAIKADNLANNMRRLGWKLTWMVTAPILLTVFFGVPGLIIGLIIIAAMLFKKKK